MERMQRRTHEEKEIKIRLMRNKKYRKCTMGEKWIHYVKTRFADPDLRYFAKMDPDSH